MKKLLIILLAMSTLSVGMAGAAPKSDVCHYDADADAYHLINISDNAIDKHIEHGDAEPGTAVPTAPGYEFDTECEAVVTVVTGSANLFVSGWDCTPSTLAPAGTVTWKTYLTTLEVTYILTEGAAIHGYSVGFSTDSPPANPMPSDPIGTYEAAFWTFGGNCGLTQYLTRFDSFATDANGDFSETVTINVNPGVYETIFYITEGWQPKFQTGDSIGDYVTVTIPDYS